MPAGDLGLSHKAQSLRIRVQRRRPLVAVAEAVAQLRQRFVIRIQIRRDFDRGRRNSVRVIRRGRTTRLRGECPFTFEIVSVRRTEKQDRTQTK